MALLASPDVGVRGRAFLKSDPTPENAARVAHATASSLECFKHSSPVLDQDEEQLADCQNLRGWRIITATQVFA